VLPTQLRWKGQRVAVVDGDSVSADDLPVTNREMGERFTDSTVVRVCAACNNGWMSDLEEATRLVLSALIAGESISVSLLQAESLAFWVAKTCVMAELTHPESAATPPHHFRYMHEDRMPPPGMHIWALNTDADDWGVRLQHFGILYGDPSELSYSEPCNTQSTTIGLGRAAFCVIATTQEVMPLPSLDDMPPLNAVRIWPNPVGFTWGQTRPLGNEDVWVVSDLLRLWLGDDDDAFLNALMGLGFRNT